MLKLFTIMFFSFPEQNKYIYEEQLLDIQNNWDSCLFYLLNNLLIVLAQEKKYKNHQILHIAVCRSLMLYPKSIKEPRDLAKVVKYFDFLYSRIVATKIPLPDIYLESIDLITNCTVLSALFTPCCGVCRLVDVFFQFSLPFINYSSKDQYNKKLWLKAIFFLCSYCHILDTN